MVAGLDTALLGYGLLAGAGGVCYQGYRHAQTNNRVDVTVLLANVSVSAFLGIIVGGFVASRYPDAVLLSVGACGFWSLPIAKWVEKHGGAALQRRLGVAPEPQQPASESAPPPVPIPDYDYLPEGPQRLVPEARLGPPVPPSPLPMGATQNMRSMLRALKAEGMLPGGARNER